MRKKIWNEGMTLIETAIVVSTISIVIALSIPSVTSFKIRYQLNSQVSALQSDIQRARIKSISLNTTYRITFFLDSYPNPDKYMGFIYDTNSPTDWIADTEMNMEMSGKGIYNNTDIAYIADSFVTLPIGEYDIYFEPDSTCLFSHPDCLDGSICLTNTKGQKRKIVISKNTGFIKVFNKW